MRLALQGKTDLGLKALSELHLEGGRLAGRDLASRIGTTANYLPQVMAPLIEAGWVRSDRGPSGGYTLIRPTSEVSLLDVIEIFEGAMRSGVCVLRGGPCHESDSCPLHAAWKEVSSLINSELGSRSLSQTIDPKEGT